MTNLNKSFTVLGQLFGLLIGSGFRAPSENVIKNYPEIRTLS